MGINRFWLTLDVKTQEGKTGSEGTLLGEEGITFILLKTRRGHKVAQCVMAK